MISDTVITEGAPATVLLPIISAIFDVSIVIGLAMGAYTGFLDLSLGVTGPVLGLVRNWAGLNAVFLSSAVVVISAAAVSFRLMHMPVQFRRAAEVSSSPSTGHSVDVPAMETF